jgi:hypothetical protein
MKRILILAAVVFGSFRFVSAQAEYSLQPCIFFTAPQMDSCDVYDSLERLDDNECFIAAVGEKVYVAKRFFYVSWYCGDTLIVELRITGHRNEPDYFAYTMQVFDTRNNMVGYAKDKVWFKNFKPYDKKFSVSRGQVIAYFNEILEFSGIPWVKARWKT